MSTHQASSPLKLQPLPEPVGSEFEPLLSEPFASLWAASVDQTNAAPALRGRLLDKLAASRLAEQGLHTVRRRRALRQPLAAGVQAQTLYTAQPGQPLRPGEPLRARLIELAAGASLSAAQLGDADQLRARHCEWLLVDGSVRCGDEELGLRDYHYSPAGCAMASWHSDSGALLFLRESDQPAQPGDIPHTVHDAEAGWPDYAPGIQRRVLWRRGDQAALLYVAQAGAQVPQHSHGHDEECLMVQGELFLDDVLLQVGDYQLAPAGTGHRITQTDTGVIIYAHGDADLKFV